MEDQIKELLAHFSYDLTLKQEQLSAITSVMDGKDTFVSLPTGYGKSMCYIIPSLLTTFQRGRQCTALVVTPLKTIMVEQRQTLMEKGIKTAVLVNKEEMADGDLEAIRLGRVDLIFTSPEGALSHFKMLTADILQVGACHTFLCLFEFKSYCYKNNGFHLILGFELNWTVTKCCVNFRLNIVCWHLMSATA